ncbi:Protein of unknown function [Pyronema omphalodes CBS 100304]|uniref:Uncharacterized protein n=1 Tax=Pyronema omphalodes (strain CBS 100304) TaxID=1076935 RepID=U4L637_PYROM|nr:Protein of unknown function [Pyronema omphalodes CBS 100304]
MRVSMPGTLETRNLPSSRQQLESRASSSRCCIHKECSAGRLIESISCDANLCAPKYRRHSSSTH